MQSLGQTVNAAVREFVSSRAGNRCEYCQRSQADASIPFEIEHIIARKHHGPTVDTNLCLACVDCNQFKGSNIAGLDPVTGELTRLYHPRIDIWDEHFRWDRFHLVGLTSVGRTTVDVLKINEPERIALREYVASQSSD